MKKVYCLFAVLLVSGCGSFLPIRDLNTVPQTIKEEALGMPMVTGAMVPKGSFDYLGVVSGHSCQNQLMDAPASREEAELRMKIQAVEMGAKAVLDGSCTALGTNYGTNCWHSFSCSGHAIKPKVDTNLPSPQPSKGSAI